MIVWKLGSLEPHTGSAAAPWQEQAHSNAAAELWLLRDLFDMWNNLKPWKFFFFFVICLSDYKPLLVILAVEKEVWLC